MKIKHNSYKRTVISTVFTQYLQRSLHQRDTRNFSAPLPFYMRKVLPLEPFSPKQERKKVMANLVAKYLMERYPEKLPLSEISNQSSV